MKQLVWCLKWLLNGAVFFTLFAFALNNQQDGTVHFFFGTQWRSPMVLIVLTAFAIGLAVGVLGMVPRWWKQRNAVIRPVKTIPPAAQPTPPQVPERSELQPAVPPLHGL